MRVEVKKNNVQKAMALLNRKLKDDGHLRLVVERSHYTPPSEKRRIKHKRAVARNRKQQLKERSEHDLYSK